MKKISIGFILGLIIALPAGAFAWSQNQVAQPIKTYDCPNYDPNSCTGTVSRFDDRDNTCYVSNDKGAISCVKKSQ